MAKQDAKDDLSIKVSHADMLAYTDQIYTDIADPAINGINTHAADESPHNLPARFAAVQSQIDDINDELATKLGTGDISLDGKADVIGDTFTGTVVFAGGDEKVVLQGPEQTDRSIIAKTGTSNRWELGVASNDDEQGSNSGSNFVVARFADNGNFLGIPFAIDRQTGVTYIDQLSVGGGDILVGEGIDVRVQNTEPVDNLKIGTVWVRPCGTTGGGAVGVLPEYGLISHIDANNAQVSGDSVVSITDSSTANNSAGSVGQPKLRTAATPSGEPAVVGGVGNYLTLPAAMWSGKLNGHIFAYVLATGGGSLSGPWRMGGSGNVARFNDTTIDDSSMRSTGTSTFTPAPSHKNAWRIYEISNSNSSQKIYLDGALQLTTSVSFGAGTTYTLLKGSEDTGHSSSFAIADFIAYDRELTAQEAADVRAYLVSKNGPTGPITTDPQYWR